MKPRSEIQKSIAAKERSGVLRSLQWFAKYVPTALTAEDWNRLVKLSEPKDRESILWMQAESHKQRRQNHGKNV